MNNQHYDIRRISTIVFGIAVVIIVLFSLFRTDTFDDSYKETITDFSDEWKDQYGNVHHIKDVKIGDYGGAFSLSKQLPGELTSNDCLCFETTNVNIKVLINDDGTVY